MCVCVCVCVCTRVIQVFYSSMFIFIVLMSQMIHPYMLKKKLFQKSFEKDPKQCLKILPLK